MRDARLIFVFLGCAASMAAAGYAAPPVALPQQTSTPNSANATPSNSGEQPAGKDTTETDRPERLAAFNQRSKGGTERNLHGPGSVKNAFAAKGGPVQNATGHTLSAARPGAVPRSVPMARHRGSNPASVGGSVIATAKGTAAINGTQVNHKR